MKNSPLRRKTPLERKPLKRRVVSEKMKAEYARRKAVRAILEERANGKCENCGKPFTWPGPQMHHLEHIQMGGCKDNTKTTPEGCLLLCHVCHSEEHGIRIVTP